MSMTEALTSLKRFVLLAPAPYWQHSRPYNETEWAVVDKGPFTGPLGLPAAETGDGEMRIAAHTYSEGEARELCGRLNYLEWLLHLPRPVVMWAFSLWSDGPLPLADKRMREEMSGDDEDGGVDGDWG